MMLKVEVAPNPVTTACNISCRRLTADGKCGVAVAAQQAIAATQNGNPEQRYRALTQRVEVGRETLARKDETCGAANETVAQAHCKLYSE